MSRYWLHLTEKYSGNDLKIPVIIEHSGNDAHIPVMTTEYSGYDGKFILVKTLRLEYESANDNSIFVSEHKPHSNINYIAKF